jgi:hypothetical protein
VPVCIGDMRHETRDLSLQSHASPTLQTSYHHHPTAPKRYH